MKNIFITLILLINFFVYGYEPIASSEDLYLRDVPVFYGLEDINERLNKYNKPIWALNLSGGSARAFAHIGVLKRLEEEGLRPDVMITDSMGSIVGLAYAAGMSVADIEDMIKTLRLSNYFNLTLPIKGGVIDLHEFEALMFALFKNMDLKNTAIPAFVITEDLITKRQVILSKGDLVKVLKAAFAIPFYFQPVNIGNFKLVDGGISSLVHIEPFITMLPNMVISSSFYSADVNLKNPLSILNVTIDISKSRRSVKQIKEFNPFLIRCNVENISFMAFDEGEEIIRRGYESCNAAIPDLLEYLKERGIPARKQRLEEFSETKDIHENWLTLKTKLNYTILPAREFGWLIKPWLETGQSFGNSHYLNQNYLQVLKAIFWYDKSLLETMVFYTDDSTGSIVRLKTMFSDYLYLNTEGQLNFSTISNNLYQYDSNYLFTELGVILSISRHFLKPIITTEFVNIENYYNSDLYFRPGLIFESGSGTSTIDLRYLIRKEADSITPGISAEYISSLPSGDTGFGLETRIYCKSALNNFSNGVELTFNDYYRSRGDSILMPLHTWYPSYLIINGNITWNIGRLMPTMGEILTTKDSTSYLFSDLLITNLFNYNGNMKFRPTIGIGIDIKASFIGLKPYTYSLSGGWDINSNQPFITFSIGTLFD